MPPRSNIIVILADDLGYGDVSFNGCPDYLTPNIDSLATNGIWCSNGYVTHPFCSPSRASLLTGRYQQRFGHENQPEGDQSNPRLGLPMQELILPQILKPTGYVCGAVGKWHLGTAPNMRPLQRGFDEFFGFLGSGSPYFNASILQNNTLITETAYLTDAFTREGVSFINRHATEPFFLYLAYNAVHVPYDTPPPSYMDRVANISDPERQLYAAMVTALDDGVGQVLHALQAQNLLDKTLIFFLSDNGAPLNNFARNFPLRGGKLTLWEGGIRVPFAVQWTGHLPTHGIYDQPISSLDIVATAAAAAGVSLPTDRDYDGLNVIPFLAGERASPQRTLFWRWFGLGKDGPPGSVDTNYAVRSGSLKLIRQDFSNPELYNLSLDISESQNLALTQPFDLASLKELYTQWETELIAPLWQAPKPWSGMMVLAGDWNAFNKADSTVPWRLTKITAPGAQGTPDGCDWLVNTIHVAATGGDTTPGMHSFVLVAGHNYSTQWGGATININGTSSIPFFSGSALAPPNTISLLDGFYYSFRIIDWTLNVNMTVAVMKTSAPPISISVTGQTPISPTSDNSVVVSMVTSQPKSMEERIYLRWSTDSFITSHVVEAVGSGVNYSALIPAQPEGMAVQYCVTTSTADLLQLKTSGAIDALTLSTSANSKFVVNAATPTPTPSPTPSPTADLKITVTDGKTTIAAGSRSTYTITVANAGPVAVTGASVIDTFPTIFTGVTFTATQSGGATGFTASGSGNIADTVNLPAGGKITYKATGKLSSAATGTLSNTATVTAPAGISDPNTANNIAKDSDLITFKADLKVTITDGKAAATPGTKNTYTLVVTNAGPSNVTGAVIWDTCPAAFTAVIFTATQTGGATSFSATGSGNINDTVNMPAGSKITYKATGTISASATGSISNTATVKPPSSVADPNSTNNSATDTDTL